MIINKDQRGIYENQIESGLRLAEMSEAEGGWAEYFDPERGLEIKDDISRAHTAILLENAKLWLGRLCGGRRNGRGGFEINEAVRATMLGGFSDYIFPIIRAVAPTNPVNELFSVQPTTRRTATILSWHWVYGSSKGLVAKGQRMVDANSGIPFSAGGSARPQNYSGEYIDGEAAGNGDGSTAVISGTLSYITVRPGTVNVAATHSTAGAVTFSDDGNGAFTQSSGTGLTISASSINYETGAWSITVSAGNFTTAAVTATYTWNSEGQSLPEIDVNISTSTAETTRRGMKLNYSIESMQEVSAEFGQVLEPKLLAGATDWLNYEIAGQLISIVWGVAPSAGSFDLTTPSGISQEQHFRSIMYLLNAASNNIWQRTQKGYGNWLLVDIGAANIIESLPKDLFEAAPRPTNTVGVHFIGTLGGKYRVYKDLFLRNEAGASSVGNILMGYKGNDFFDAGLVFAPYQLLYTTDTLVTADFLAQKGLASRYAVKLVNPNMYARLSITSSSGVGG